MKKLVHKKQKHYIFMGMAKLPSMLTIAWFLLFMTIINQSSSARTLGSIPSPTHDHTHSSHTPITFLMQDALDGTRRTSRPATTKVNNQLPFSKPLGLFPPSGGIPLPEPNPTISTQTLDLSSIGLSFPAIATLQELEFGTVRVIDEDLLEGSVFGSSPIFGKAQGIYVASSEDGSSHMMAMTVIFANGEFKDSLRFFGVHRTDVSESHIAVIGGSGKYRSANGYATVKAVTIGSNAVGNESEGANILLLFNVYLSY